MKGLRILDMRFPMLLHPPLCRGHEKLVKDAFTACWDSLCITLKD